MAKELLRLENLSKYYTSTQSVVMGLNNINVSFERGEFVAITGESGSGKSTLASVIGGMLPYESGELFFEGNPTSHFDSADYERYRRDHISFISQNYGILIGCTVMENVVSALRLSGMEQETAVCKAEEILQEVELWEMRGRRAAKLSSGQKQRLSIARALAKPAPILIADEPTGNLDPENSAKVIELLAKAAKDRLVILITHEFEEAADQVTRHIVIQDGQISMDASLKPFAAVDSPVSAKRSGKGRPLSLYVSRLQLGGRPVWSSLVLLFFSLTAFAVFAFLGTFVVALDDTNTRIYDASAFLNGDKTRVVVAKLDSSPMTTEDYEKLLQVEYVKQLETYGYLTDIQYAYQDGVDYKTYYQRVDSGTWDDPDLSMKENISILPTAPFMKSIPLLAGEETFLAAGRLPENMYEVVLSGDEDQIGQVIAVYIRDDKNWGYGVMLKFDMTVVGVTHQGSGLYFHGDMGRMFTTAVMDNAVAGSDNWLNQYQYMLAPNEELADEQWRCSEIVYGKLKSTGYETMLLLNLNTENLMDVLTGDSAIDAFVRKQLIEEFNEQGILPYHTQLYNKFAEVSPQTFEELMWKKNSDQVSLNIEDYAYTDRVLEAVQGMGYLAVSPFKESSTKQDPELAAERMQTLTVCAAALLAVVLLQVVVLRALFGTQTESYRLFRNIGLTCSTANYSILWQVLLFTLGGQVVGFAGILICRAANVARIVELMRYLPAVYILLLSGVHLAASLIAGYWIIHALDRQVYPLAGRQTDLALETEEVAL